MVRRVLSLGSGVQSSTILMMAVLGLLEIDAAVFSDTGWEPVAVYRYLEWLKKMAVLASIPLVTVSGGDLREDETSPTRHRGAKGKYTLIPWYTTLNGKKGRLFRQCTSRYKIEPIQRWLRSTGASLEQPVELLLGISLDEYTRMRTSPIPYLVNTYPLIERRMTRQDCLDWMARYGFPQPPKSACIICPFRRDAGWRKLRHDSPQDWEEAVQFDHLLRSGHYTAFDATAYVHDSRQPLGDVPLGDYTAADDEAPQADECGVLCPADESLDITR